MYLFMDFETYSFVDLIKTGVQKYARHPDADVICGVFSLVDAQRNCIDSTSVTRGSLNSECVGVDVNYVNDLINKAQFIIAHNIEFDLEIYTQILVKKYNFLQIDTSKKLICTKKRQSFYNQIGKKSSLKYAASWFGLEQQKSDRGKFLINNLSIPNKKTGLRNYDDALEAEMLKYCLQDVKTLECLFFAQQDFAKIFRIKNNDYKIQVLDLEINQTGFPVNLELASKILEVSEEDKAKAQLDFCTYFEDFKLPSLTQVAAIKAFIKNKFDYNLVSFTDVPQDVPLEVKQVLDFREKATKSSLSKADAVLDRAYEGRIYGALQYAGAHTMRWAGYGLQPHNLPRTADEKDPKSFLRNLIATGSDSSLIYPDYESIEHKAVFYMLMQYIHGFELEDRGSIKHYANFFKGVDAYLEFAAEIYDVEVKNLTKKSIERTVGKVAHLGLAYGMGAQKFGVYTTDFGIDLTKHKTVKVQQPIFNAETGVFDKSSAEMSLIAATHAQESQRIVNLYRAKYPSIKKLWRYLLDNFISCVRQNEDCDIELFWDMKIKYVAKLPFIDENCLCLSLPNGRPLFYYNLSLVEQVNDYGKTYDSLKIDGEFYHGGKILENIIQGLCRDLLAEHMLEISKALKFAKIVMHVHDEIVVESLDENLNYNKEIIEEICKTPPKWMEGFPLSYETTVSKFYRK
jgi:DNA polymerase